MGDNVSGGGGGISQEEISSATLTADGSEQNVLDTSGLGEYEGYVDLTNMTIGDAITIKEYIKLKTGGGWRQYSHNLYSDGQSEPAVHQVRKLSKHGVRISLKQTAGVNRDYDYNFLKVG